MDVLNVAKNKRFYHFVKRSGHGTTASISIHFSFDTKLMSLLSFGLVVKKSTKSTDLAGKRVSECYCSALS